MHHQSTTTLAALLLLLSPTTFAAAMPPSRPVAPGMEPICRSATLTIAAGRAPDCSMVRCMDDGKLSLLGAPEQCIKICKCPPPSPPMKQDPTTGMGPAPIVKGNPVGTTYSATLVESEKSGIRGFVSGSSSADGQGVDFTIELSGFPDASLGPFSYHIHDQPVPADGNCTATRAHLDPYERGPMPPCDPTQLQTCEVGDLSGKYGTIDLRGKHGKSIVPRKHRKTVTNSFTASYTDLYLSTMEGPESFFGNRSVVFHQRNSTRLTCANFMLASPS